MVRKEPHCDVIPNAGDLAAKRCVPCEGGVPAITTEQAAGWMRAIPAWRLDDNGKWIRRRCVYPNFVSAIRVLNQVADVAESEQHHPDLAVTGYRNLEIALTTHAIGGLSENDFVLAAKIEAILIDSEGLSASSTSTDDRP
ncbi:MAG: 4a-hydroxytetrahydrobiopterin dehydratase [Planctomycetota bacterium]